MALLQWRPSFATGITSVDHEHQELITLINQLHDRIAQPGSAARDGVLGGFLGELHDAIAAHFALEETIMRASAWPGYAAHKADHERLLDEIRDLMEEEIRGGFGDPRASLAPRLDDWFSRHFRSFDAALHGRQAG